MTRSPDYDEGYARAKEDAFSAIEDERSKYVAGDKWRDALSVALDCIRALKQKETKP